MLPWHPSIVHFPLALAFLLPFGILIQTILIKKSLVPAKAWIGIILLQAVITGSGYIAMETGENDEKIVKTVMEKKYIHEHEEAAEKFVGVTVLTLALSVAVYFLSPALQFPIRLGILALSLLSCYLAYETGHRGGELVYIHGAADAYDIENSDEPLEEENGILPTPGMNTSESEYPEVEELPAE